MKKNNYQFSYDADYYYKLCALWLKKTNNCVILLLEEYVEKKKK